MLRALTVIAFVLAHAILAAQAQAQAQAQTQTQEQIDTCTNLPKRFSADVSIGGCTALIQSGRYSGRELSWAFYNRGNAYFEKKEYDPAISDYTTANQLDPTYAPALYNRGNSYLRKAQYDRAIEDYNKAIALNPQYALAFANRALAYESKGERERAITDFRTALALGDAESAEDLRRLGATP